VAKKNLKSQQGLPQETLHLKKSRVLEKRNPAWTDILFVHSWQKKSYVPAGSSAGDPTFKEKPCLDRYIICAFVAKKNLKSQQDLPQETLHLKKSRVLEKRNPARTEREIKIFDFSQRFVISTTGEISLARSAYNK
jgi:hypothetical protein